MCQHVFTAGILISVSFHHTGSHTNRQTTEVSIEILKLGECRALWGSPDTLTYTVCTSIIILRVIIYRLGGPGGAAQLIREAGGGVCDVANCRSSLTVCSFKFVVASFLVSRPAFRHLPYCKRCTASNEKLGVGLGTRYQRGVPQVAERISPSS